MHEIKDKFHIKELKKYYHYNHSSNYVFLGHRHQDIELNIILDGEMEITCEQGIYKVKKGEMILVPSYAFHQNRVTGNTNAEMVVVQFDVSVPVIHNNFFVCSMDNDIQSLVNMFCKEMEVNSRTRNGDCIAISENALKLLEVFLQYSFGGEKISKLRENENSLVYNRAVRYMQENLNSKLTVADIAHECGVCTTTLKKFFAYYTGKGCISFFNELKLERAKELLQGGKSCLEVSEELGYSSQGYFSRKFRQMYGDVPVKYRKL